MKQRLTDYKQRQVIIMQKELMIDSGCKWVMIGDSISDCERARPYGEGLFEGIGKSYVGLVDALLKVTYPEKKIRIINMGNSGDNIRDLKNRWQTDVIDLKPDWVSILIGANDVWRQFDSPLLKEQHILPEEYEGILEELICRTLPLVKGIMLFAPYYMELNREDAMRKRMDEYNGIVRKLAKRYELPCVDLQEVFCKALQDGHPNQFSWDRVHPNLAGQMLIAKAVLNRIGFEW